VTDSASRPTHGPSRKADPCICKAAFTPAQHVARQQVARTSNTLRATRNKLRATCCERWCKRVRVYTSATFCAATSLPATCSSNMLRATSNLLRATSNMLRWCKRGITDVNFVVVLVHSWRNSLMMRQCLHPTRPFNAVTAAVTIRSSGHYSLLDLVYVIIQYCDSCII